MQLFGEEPAGEISDHPGLDFAGLNSRVGDGAARRLQDNVANRLALLLEVALEVGTPGANDIDSLGHNRIGGAT